MSKPWDCLREVVRKPLLGPGEWQGVGTPAVFIENIRNKHVGLKIGAPANNSIQIWTADGLRQMAEFCTELADQLDGK